MRIPLVRGRSLSSLAGQASPLPAVVSATFARTLGQGREVIGTELWSDDTSFVVVGVAGDVKTTWLSQPAAAEIYVPLEAGAVSTLSVVIRTDNEPRAIRALADTVARLHPNGPLVAAESMTSIVGRSEQRRWFYSVLVSLFAFLSVAVSIVGVSGAVAQVVALRAREMGIRVALGASQSTVVWLVMRQGLRASTLGVLAGAVGAWWTGSLLQANSLFRSLMFQVSPADPWPFALVALAVVAVSLLAAWAPARLVVRSNPAATLREL
jgi:putative ABC transport system permease protein